MTESRRKRIAALIGFAAVTLLLSGPPRASAGPCGSTCSATVDAGGGGSGGAGGGPVPGTTLVDQPVVVCRDCGTVDTRLGNGGSVLVSGSGFAPNTQVSASLRFDRVLLGSTTTDGSGNFSMTVTLPRATSLGRDEILVTGLGQDGVPFSVIGANAVGFQVFVADTTSSVSEPVFPNNDNATSDLVTDAKDVSAASNDGGGDGGGAGGAHGGSGGG